MKAKLRSTTARPARTGSPRAALSKVNRTRTGSFAGAKPARSERPDKPAAKSYARTDKTTRPARTPKPAAREGQFTNREERFSRDEGGEKTFSKSDGPRPVVKKREDSPRREKRATSTFKSTTRERGEREERSAGPAQHDGPKRAGTGKPFPKGPRVERGAVRNERSEVRPARTQTRPERYQAIPPAPAIESDEAVDDLPELVYGRQSTLAALGGERGINKVWIIERLRYDSRFLTLLDQAKANSAVVEVVDHERLDQICDGGNHQGVAAQMAAYRYWELENLVTQALTAHRPVIVVAEGIEDPQNLGSLIRSCEAMGVQGLILPQRRAAGVTTTVAKVSAGAIEHLPISRVVNLRQALDRLKEAGFWVVGTDAQADKDIFEIDLTGPTVVVIGSEHKGLSLMIQKCCDLITRIPLLGKTPSLNAAVAGAVVVYELLRQRQGQRLHLEG